MVGGGTPPRQGAAASVQTAAAARGAPTASGGSKLIFIVAPGGLGLGPTESSPGGQQRLAAVPAALAGQGEQVEQQARQEAEEERQLTQPAPPWSQQEQQSSMYVAAQLSQTAVGAGRTAAPRDPRLRHAPAAPAAKATAAAAAYTTSAHVPIAALAGHAPERVAAGAVAKPLAHGAAQPAGVWDTAHAAAAAELPATELAQHQALTASRPQRSRSQQPRHPAAASDLHRPTARPAPAAIDPQPPCIDAMRTQQPAAALPPAAPSRGSPPTSPSPSSHGTLQPRCAALAPEAPTALNHRCPDRPGHTALRSTLRGLTAGRSYLDGRHTFRTARLRSAAAAAAATQSPPSETAASAAAATAAASQPAGRRGSGSSAAGGMGSQLCTRWPSTGRRRLVSSGVSRHTVDVGRMRSKVAGGQCKAAAASTGACNAATARKGADGGEGGAGAGAARRQEVQAKGSEGAVSGRHAEFDMGHPAAGGHGAEGLDGPLSRAGAEGAGSKASGSHLERPAKEGLAPQAQEAAAALTECGAGEGLVFSAPWGRAGLRA